MLVASQVPGMQQSRRHSISSRPCCGRSKTAMLRSLLMLRAERAQSALRCDAHCLFYLLTSRCPLVLVVLPPACLGLTLFFRWPRRDSYLIPFVSLSLKHARKLADPIPSGHDHVSRCRVSIRQAMVVVLLKGLRFLSTLTTREVCLS